MNEKKRNSESAARLRAAVELHECARQGRRPFEYARITVRGGQAILDMTNPLHQRTVIACGEACGLSTEGEDIDSSWCG